MIAIVTLFVARCRSNPARPASLRVSTWSRGSAILAKPFRYFSQEELKQDGGY